ncbi:MAG: YceI family protein [Gemmatimonadaceae bacterium]
MSTIRLSFTSLAIATLVIAHIAPRAPVHAQPGAAHPSAAHPSAARPRDYRVDAGHSAVEFSIPFLYGRVKGRFDGLRGTILYDDARPVNSSVTMVIEAASLKTGSAHRDEHLRSPDFFDVERFPRITFQSARVSRARDGSLLATGPLAMHGVTKEVTIPFRATHPPVADPHGSRIVSFAGALKLARKDFGIMGGREGNPWFDELRSATMGDTVEITLEVEGWDTDFDRKRDAGMDSALARIARDGVAATVVKVRAMKAKNPAAMQDEEWGIDQMGKALLSRGRTGDALEIFKLNAELFPRSAQAQTSLGDAHERLGDRTAAIGSYERAIGLDASETRARELRRRVR